jgi:hypothetical protein
MIHEIKQVMFVETPHGIAQVLLIMELNKIPLYLKRLQQIKVTE